MSFKAALAVATLCAAVAVWFVSQQHVSGLPSLLWQQLKSETVSLHAGQTLWYDVGAASRVKITVHAEQSVSLTCNGAIVAAQLLQGEVVCIAPAKIEVKDDRNENTEAGAALGAVFRDPAALDRAMRPNAINITLAVQ